MFESMERIEASWRFYGEETSACEALFGLCREAAEAAAATVPTAAGPPPPATPPPVVVESTAVADGSWSDRPFSPASSMPSRIRLQRAVEELPLIHTSEPTRLGMTSYAVLCLKK